MGRAAAGLRDRLAQVEAGAADLSGVTTAPGPRRARRLIAAALAAVLVGGCVSTTDAATPGDGAGSTGAGVAGRHQDPPSRLAATDRSPTAADPPPALLPPIAPTGARLQTCGVDYGEVDWSADPAVVVAAHAAASTPPCTSTGWYRETAHQNGVLAFVVLVGQQALDRAALDGAEAPAQAASLQAQGFHVVTRAEIGGSGRCEDGEVQAALLGLADDHRPVGLRDVLRSAEAGGAIVQRYRGYTMIEGGGAPCAAAIVHSGDLVGWISSADRRTLEEVVASLDLPAGAERPLTTVVGARPAFG